MKEFKRFNELTETQQASAHRDALHIGYKGNEHLKLFYRIKDGDIIIRDTNFFKNGGKRK